MYWSGSWQESAYSDRIIKESSTLWAGSSDVNKGYNAVPWGSQQWRALTTPEPERLRGGRDYGNPERGAIGRGLPDRSCNFCRWVALLKANLI